MNAKFKSSIGLAAIIIGIGISWMIVGKVISPMIKSNKLRVQSIKSVLDVKNIKEGTRFYEKVFSGCEIDSLQTDERKIKINSSEFYLVKTEKVYKSRLNVKVSSLKNFEDRLKSEKIDYTAKEKSISFYDPDSNLVLVK